MAIATELRQLIDYHNVRVYRLAGEELLPVAMEGQVGEYVDETPDQLRVALGEGITGWVAEHRLAQNLGDAADDPRADTIPGTEDDLDESMLLAPMIFDDKVLGVLVLSKLGLDQFSDDDLRLLVIYASFAAQAMANADTTEQLREQTRALERQVRSQRELLQITESILTQFDGRRVLESITERLGALDRLRQHRHRGRRPGDRPADAADRARRPRVGVPRARGSRARPASRPGSSSTTSRPTSSTSGPTRASTSSARSTRQEGSLIVVPLRGRDGAVGVLTLERLGHRQPVLDRGVRARPAVRGAGLDRAAERRGLRGGRDPRPDRRPDRPAQPRDLPGLARAQRPRAATFSLIMLDLDDFRDVNNDLGHQAGDDACSADRPGARPRRPRHATSCSGMAATSSRSSSRAPTGPGRSRSPTVHAWPSPRRATLSTHRSASPRSRQDGATAIDILLAADRACFVAKRSGRDRVVTALEGLALGQEVPLQQPTPVDSPVQPTMPAIGTARTIDTTPTSASA